MAYQRACSLAEIPSDTNVFGTEVDGQPVAVVRDADGDLHAVDNVCSHAYVLLSEGEVEDGSIECWLHGSRFDLRTGRPTGLPAVRPIDVYPVRRDGDDVLVDVAAPSTVPGPVSPTGQTTPTTIPGTTGKES